MDPRIKVEDCAACGKPVAVAARACPNCGQPTRAIAAKRRRNRRRKLFAASALAIGSLAFAYVRIEDAASGSPFPSCEGDDAKQEVTKIFGQNPMASLAGTRVIDLSGMAERSTTPYERTCWAIGALSDGSHRGLTYVFYTENGSVMAKAKLDDPP